MTRWLGALILLAVVVGGCAVPGQPDSRPDAPRSFQDKRTEGNGGGGGY